MANHNLSASPHLDLVTGMLSGVEGHEPCHLSHSSIVQGLLGCNAQALIFFLLKCSNEIGVVRDRLKN
jgi:hypothetical protein